jgi:type II secretory ATPase GspE/PulE/Tfp pilus assembly ATPase PilB-like protein
MSIHTILVPFDFSPQSVFALEKACHLGQELRATLHLITVKEGSPDESAERHLMDRLLAALPPAYELQNKVHREVLRGRIHDELIEYAKRCRADLIVMGSRARSGFLRLATGSVTQSVLKDSPCPVVMVKANMLDVEHVQDEADIKYEDLKQSDSPALDLLTRAISLRATDIHIDPLEEDQFGVRFRIDGTVAAYCQVDVSIAEHLMQQYLTLARLDNAESFRPREGRLILPASMHDFEARVTTTPVAGGRAMALRIFSKENVYLPLESLGFSTTGLESVKKVLQGGEGLVLVTGPTGSGKTTTVYSMLETYGGTNNNMVSIEDPVEFDVPFVRQVNVDERHGVTMTSGLKTILRMDPDIVFVGEIRDAENADIAFRAAGSGQFVFSTLHTRDVASTFTGLRDLGMTNRTLAGNLVGVVNQRLIRKLCEKCRQATEPNESCQESFYELGLDLPASVYQAVGCDACRGTGFKGRCGVFECVQIDFELAELIANNATEAELRRQIRSKGISSLTAEAMLKVRNGITSFEEANSLRWL